MHAASNRQPPALKVAAARLAEKIDMVSPGSGWQRLVQPVDAGTELLAWLAAGQSVCVYWSERDELNCEVAGQGVALSIKLSHAEDLDECEAAIRELFSHCPTARLYGGLAFFDSREEHWDGFGGGELILPRYELSRQGKKLELICNLNLPEGVAGEELRTKISKDAQALQVAEDFPRDIPKSTVAREIPDWQTWQEQVSEALAAMDSGELDKLVLSREQQLSVGGDLCPWSVLSLWQELTPKTYRYGFSTGDNHCFFGASPERLYRRNGVLLESEALAGTAPRGHTPVQDRRFAATLLVDDKNRRENSLVLQAVRTALQHCSDSIESSDEIALIQLKNVQHLRQLVRARLKPDTSDATLLKLLHPTPAVGGAPREQALSKLQMMESHVRGWYAAPFGCIGKGYAEFAVALRCARLQGRKLSLYAGAGLVPGSSADAEWAELDSKLRTVQSILNLSL